MSVTLQLSLLHLTDKFSLDESFMHPRLYIVLLFELNDIAVMLLSGKSMQFDTVKNYLNKIYDQTGNGKVNKMWIMYWQMSTKLSRVCVIVERK